MFVDIRFVLPACERLQVTKVVRFLFLGFDALPEQRHRGVLPGDKPAVSLRWHRIWGLLEPDGERRERAGRC